MTVRPDPRDRDLFGGIPPLTPADGGAGDPMRPDEFPGREDLAAMPRDVLVGYAEELQKEYRLLAGENKFLNWEFKSNLSFFSRAAKLAHRLNASMLETVVNVAVDEIADVFNCAFAAIFLYNEEKKCFELAKSTRKGVGADEYLDRDEFLSKLFISRPEAYLVDYAEDTGCLVFEDGEIFECEIPDNWNAVVNVRAMVFPLRVPRPDSHEPQFLGGLVLGDARDKLEGRDAEAAQFFGDILSASLHNAQLVESLNALTIVDPLTNIFNRRYLLHQLNSSMKLALRQSHDLSIAMIDIDNFKRFNDDHGHIYGDEVLKEVGRILKSGLRTGIDVPARYGGEEFTLIMPFTGLPAAMNVSERLRAAIRDAGVAVDGRKLSVTCSFGVAQYVSGESIESFIDRADAALYRAKRGGRDQVVAAVNPPPNPVK